MRNTTIIAWAAAAILAFSAGCGDSGEPISEDIPDMPDTLRDVVDTDGVEDAEQDTVPPEQIVRFIFVSDIHYRVTEGGTRDDSYLQARVDLINAIEGDFDALVTGGDNFDHILPAWHDLEAMPAQDHPMYWFVEEMNKLKMPWRAAIGNHEFYDFHGDLPVLTTDGDARGAVFSEVMERPLYSTWEIDGVKLIVLNSLEEGAWGETHGLMGKFSTEQFEWLRTELDSGKPAMLFFHHPPSSFAPVSPGGQLCEVLEEYPGQVKAIFAGHLHGFFKGDYCGVPYYMVENFQAAENKWFEVEYNATTDTLTLLNEADIPFPVVPDFTCEPGESTITDPAAATGTFQRMTVSEGVSDATGLGEMLGEMMSAIPFVFSFDGYNSENGYQSRLSIASRWEIDNYLTYVDGSPCLEIPLRWKEGAPCFEAGPVSMLVQLIPFLSAVSDDPVNPEWSAALDIRNMVLEGRIGDDGQGVPVIVDGIITATLMRDQTLNDMKTILVNEYCGGRTSGCTPGEGTLPACAAELDEAAVATIYEAIAYKCDTQIMGFGAQMLIDMVATLPDETHITGKLGSEVLAVAPLEDGGAITDQIFSTEAGMNCAAQ